MEEKEKWLQKNLEKTPYLEPIIYGKTFRLFGVVYNVENSPLEKKLQSLRNPTIQNIQRCYDTFYKEQAETYISPRVDYFASKMNVFYKSVGFRKMKRRWGSCSSEGVLTFNTRLMQKEVRFIDEVIVHELAHRIHFNHSKAFRQLVEAVLSSHREG